MPPDFLNSREDATLFLAAAALVYVTIKAPSILRGFADVFRAFFAFKLVLLWTSLFVYSALVVYAANRLDLWHRPALKATVYWFVIVGIVLAGEAVATAPSRELLRKVIPKAFGWTILVEFFVNLYVLPFGIELFVVFFTTLFAGLAAWGKYPSSGITPEQQRSYETALGYFGIFFLVYAALRALTDLGGFLTRENAEDLLVVPLFTLALIPFVYAWSFYSRHEQERLRRRFRARSSSPA